MSLILSIRTDQPKAEIGLFSDKEKIIYETWQADRHLSESIHRRIENLLKTKGHKLSDLTGIICFKGPGSFTGLRIGLTVANALAYNFAIPVISSTGEDWLQSGLDRISKGENEDIAIPFYGAEPNISKPKK